MKRLMLTILAIAAIVTSFITALPAESAQAQGNWTKMTSGTTAALYGVWVGSSSSAFAVGESGTIVRYTGGTSWTSMSGVPTTVRLYSVWGSSSSNIFAVGQQGTVLRYNGASWTKMTGVPTTFTLYGVGGTSSSNVFAVGSYGTILRYNGASWINMGNVPTSRNLQDVWGTPGGDILVVGEGGVVLRLDGNTWTDISGPYEYPYWNNLFGVWGTSGSNIYAAGQVGTITHYTGSWSTMTSAYSRYLRDIWGSASNDIFIVGGSTGEGSIQHYDGNSWQAMTNPAADKQLWSVHGIPGGIAFAVGDDGTILNYTGQQPTTPTPTQTVCPPPQTPQNPTPADGATDISIDVNLVWTQLDGDYWEVYFGTTDPPPFKERAYSNWYTLTDLDNGTTYYWKVKAWKDCGSSAESPVWSFTTTPETVTRPSIPEGLAVGELNRVMEYTTGGSTSNLGNPVEYNISWDDGTYSGWLPSSSPEATHFWTQRGTYAVKAQARSSTGVLSKWSEPRSVTVNLYAAHLGIVPIDLTGSTIDPGHDEEYFEEMADTLKEYYTEASYGTLAIDVDVYAAPNGGWYSLSGTEQQYKDKIDKFFHDAISSCDTEVDFAKYNPTYN